MGLVRQSATPPGAAPAAPGRRHRAASGSAAGSGGSGSDDGGPSSFAIDIEPFEIDATVLLGPVPKALAEAAAQAAAKTAKVLSAIKERAAARMSDVSTGGRRRRGGGARVADAAAEVVLFTEGPEDSTNPQDKPLKAPVWDAPITGLDDDEQSGEQSGADDDGQQVASSGSFQSMSSSASEASDESEERDARASQAAPEARRQSPRASVVLQDSHALEAQRIRRRSRRKQQQQWMADALAREAARAERRAAMAAQAAVRAAAAAAAASPTPAITPAPAAFDTAADAPPTDEAAGAEAAPVNESGEGALTEEAAVEEPVATMWQQQAAVAMSSGHYSSGVAALLAVKRNKQLRKKFKRPLFVGRCGSAHAFAQYQSGEVVTADWPAASGQPGDGHGGTWLVARLFRFAPVARPPQLPAIEEADSEESGADTPLSRRSSSSSRSMRSWSRAAGRKLSFTNLLPVIRVHVNAGAGDGAASPADSPSSSDARRRRRSSSGSDSSVRSWKVRRPAVFGGGGGGGGAKLLLARPPRFNLPKLSWRTAVGVTA